MRLFKRKHQGTRADHVKQLFKAARELGVKHIELPGENGLFLVSTSDFVMAPYYALHGNWAHRTVRTIRSFFAAQGNGLFVDVGANVGMTTVPIAHAGIHCIAVEPAPDNFDLLQANILANKVSDRIEVHNCAVGNKAGRVMFELSETNHGDHRLKVSTAPGAFGEEKRPSVTVEMRTLDELCGPLHNGSLALKIDVQGAEALVFAGAENAIARAGLVISEFWPYGLQRAGGDREAILGAVRSFASVAMTRDDEASSHVRMASPDAVDYLQTAMKERVVDPDFHLDLVLHR